MKIWDKYNWELLAVLLYCFFLAYFAPAGFSRIGFLPLLWFAYRSKNNALWLIVLLVFIDNPAYFFVGGTRELVGRTPLYPLPGGGVSFNELLALVLIIKSFGVRNAPITYKGGLTALLVIVGYTLAISLAFTITTATMVAFVRKLIYWFFIFSIPKLLASKNDWLMFYKLLSPLIFLIFIDQLHVFMVGKPLAGIFSSELTIYHAMREVQEGGDQVSRAISGAVSIFIIYIVSLIIITNADLKRNFKTAYLYIVVFTAYFVVILSATRGWFLSFTFMFIAASLVAGGKQMLSRIAPYSILVIILFSISLNFSPVLQTQLGNAWARLGTLEMVAQGDLSAGGTVSRWTEVTPTLLGYIKENPLGYGATIETFEHENDHAGTVNPMITIGVLGYLILIVFIFGFMYKLFHYSQQMRQSNPYKNSLLVAVLAFAGLWAIHLTSRQIFGLNVNLQFNILTPYLFGIGNWLIIESYKYASSYSIEQVSVISNVENFQIIETSNPSLKT